jgi:hypothetical protein|tara:strand:- start:4055 stop:4330 length:276 start_codon:yes stop_codon:yes gene_type:complete
MPKRLYIVNFFFSPIKRKTPNKTSKTTIKIDRGNTYGNKKSILKTVGPKYSSSLNEKPTGSLILIKPENINNKPTNNLEKLTKYFIYYSFK